jgi:hypothetical protein
MPKSPKPHEPRFGGGCTLPGFMDIIAAILPKFYFGGGEILYMYIFPKQKKERLLITETEGREGI